MNIYKMSIFVFMLSCTGLLFTSFAPASAAEALLAAVCQDCREEWPRMRCIEDAPFTFGGRSDGAFDGLDVIVPEVNGKSPVENASGQRYTSSGKEPRAVAIGEPGGAAPCEASYSKSGVDRSRAGRRGRCSIS